MTAPPTAQEALAAIKFLGMAATCDKCEPETAHRVGLVLDELKAFSSTAAAEAWAKIEAWCAGGVMLHVYRINGDWFVAESPAWAKEAWSDYYSVEWDDEDAEPDEEHDENTFEIEGRGPNGEDMVKTFAEWAASNGPGWLAHEL